LPESDKRPAADGRKRWRRTPRRYCSDRCKREGYILSQAAKILFRLDRAEWWEILQAITDHQKAMREGYVNRRMYPKGQNC
jgi:hypothetical protein